MSNYQDLINSIEIYRKRYRGPESPDLAIGPLYDLFPHKEPAFLDCELKWPDTWANSSKSGIYVFIDLNLNILYVGKSTRISSRLSVYCAYDNDKCKLKHSGWSSEPRYLLTVGVPDDMKWEASGLEEYLISKLKPIDNTRIL